jgi:guanylate kinase
MSGTLFIVSAPSGAGKTSLVAELLKNEPLVRKSVSYTTRPPRPGEQDGREYHFVSPETFESMVQRGEFLESAHVHGNRYGTSGAWVAAQIAEGHDIVLEIDWQGAARIRALKPDTVGIFVLPPSYEALEQRLKGRAQDGADVIARRLANARGEISHVGEYDYVIINEDFNRAVQDLISIVRAHRLSLPRQLARHRVIIERMK